MKLYRNLFYLFILLGLLTELTYALVYMHNHPARRWAVMEPSGKVVESLNYQQAVNQAGGRDLKHEFQYGDYVNGKWEPSGRVLKW